MSTGARDGPSADPVAAVLFDFGDTLFGHAEGPG